jgi:2-keto-4-pentenoate hydratase/2-oxohepta-3-ene-1,7-dioic acid hydratase in catechol pathway
MTKHVRFAQGQSSSWGRLEGDKVYGLTQAPWLKDRESGVVVNADDVKLLAPAEPSKIICVGLNYDDHSHELGLDHPEVPVLFIKPSTCVADPETTITRPRSSQQLDYEGELAFVVGKEAHRVSAGQAEEYIFGYTILNDVTARDLQPLDGQWTRAKCFDGFAPIGPELVSDLDPSDLAVETRLNGEIKQHSRTSQMIWSVPELLAFTSEIMTLLPGDMVSTGTPVGVGPMAEGDIVEIEIEGLGVLRNRVRWER